jgi:hypothetical protein
MSVAKSQQDSIVEGTANIWRWQKLLDAGAHRSGPRSSSSVRGLLERHFGPVRRPVWARSEYLSCSAVKAPSTAGGGLRRTELPPRGAFGTRRAVLCQPVRVVPSAPRQAGYRFERRHRQTFSAVREDQWQPPVQPLARLFPAELEQLVEKLG